MNVEFIGLPGPWMALTSAGGFNDQLRSFESDRRCFNPLKLRCKRYPERWNVVTVLPGRDPRVERSRIVVLNAAQALLGERGYDAFTVEAVVARSGVAKTTIYRHWRNRTELLHDVLSSAKPTRAVKTTGDLERDLNSLLQGVAAATDRDVYLRSMPSLVAAAQHDPELRELHDRLAEERSEGLQKLLLAAQSRGELRDDCDIELITHTLIGLVFVRRIFRRLPVDASQIAELVSTVLHGAAAVH